MFCVLQAIPPPPPPLLDLEDGEEDTEALYSMLMAWYMSGYHTGYYQVSGSVEKYCLPEHLGQVKICPVGNLFQL